MRAFVAVRIPGSLDEEQVDSLFILEMRMMRAQWVDDGTGKRRALFVRMHLGSCAEEQQRRGSYGGDFVPHDATSDSAIPAIISPLAFTRRIRSTSALPERQNTTGVTANGQDDIAHWSS